jgi:hypothetical protein
MKKYFTIAFLLLVTSKIGFCQNDSLTLKGRTFISGYYGISKYKSGPIDQSKNFNNYKFTDFYLKASLGKFTNSNTTRVISISYGQSNQDVEANINNSNVNNFSSYDFSGGYAIEKYKMFTPNFGIFAGIEGNISYYSATSNKSYNSYSSQNVNVYLNGNTNKTILYSEIFIYPGLVYFINSKWAITTQIGYLQLFTLYSQKLRQTQEFLNNEKVELYSTTENNGGCSFSPNFFMGGSGISVRYHLK